MARRGYSPWTAACRGSARHSRSCRTSPSRARPSLPRGGRAGTVPGQVGQQGQRWPTTRRALTECARSERTEIWVAGGNCGGMVMDGVVDRCCARTSDDAGGLHEAGPDASRRSLRDDGAPVRRDALPHRRGLPLRVLFPDRERVHPRGRPDLRARASARVGSRRHGRCVRRHHRRCLRDARPAFVDDGESRARSKRVASSRACASSCGRDSHAIVSFSFAEGLAASRRSRAGP